MDSIAEDVAEIQRIGAVPTILKTIRETTGLRFTLIARVLANRWIACAVHDEIDFGLKAGGELDVTTTLCAQVRDTNAPVVIDQASRDPVFCDHPTPKLYGFESYIAVPLLRPNGEYFGTLCGLDPEPHQLNNEKTISTLKLFSELVSLQLAADKAHQDSRAELLGEREDTRLREQFVAVLGHDVRNPLASIITGAELLLRKTDDENMRRTLKRIGSSAERIHLLVEDLLDLARGRLGGGIAVATTVIGDLEARLRHVVAEVQAARPERPITVRCVISGSVRCDGKRIEQLLSNLLANAVSHGAEGTPISVAIGGDHDRFTIEVANLGKPIAPDAMARLFQPYFRGGQAAPSKGLGLGLYIVSEIAKAHGGTIEVSSTPDRTAFLFSMPRTAELPPA